MLWNFWDFLGFKMVEYQILLDYNFCLQDIEKGLYGGLLKTGKYHSSRTTARLKDGLDILWSSKVTLCLSSLFRTLG